MNSWFRRSLVLSLVFGVASAAAFTSGCASIAIATAPSKASSPNTSPAANDAEVTFWNTLHAGRYEGIDAALDKLQAVYLENPNDARTAAHIGFLHLWRLTESAREPNLRPTITDEITLSRKYFGEAVSLDDSDPRFLGFLAAVTLAEGSIHHDEATTRRGYFAMKDAVSAWPEFNLFTRGYSMSRLPETDPMYQDAIADQWDTLDRCAKEKVDRNSANFAPYMAAETREGRTRVCWNSAIAPHNFEGFFMNMGDMIVKQGDAEKGRRIYAQAKLSKQYGAWPYREVLERRIEQAPENVALFRVNDPREKRDKERRMMVDSPFGCVGCHQK